MKTVHSTCFMPAEFALQSWVCFSNANYAPFIPLPNCLKSVPEAYSYVMPVYGYDPNSAACRFKELNALAAQNRKLYGLEIENMWEEYESIWAGQYQEALRQAKISWDIGDTEGATAHLSSLSCHMLEQALQQTDITRDDLIFHIMNDTDTLRYKFSYKTLELSEEPVKRPQFVPSVNAAEYAGLYGYSCDDSEEGLLITKGSTTVTVIPFNGKLSSKGSLLINGEKAEEIRAFRRNGGIYIPIDTAMKYLKQ